jgi:DNA-binding NtrC family response regulator
MTEKTTGAMQEFGGSTLLDRDGPPSVGLVLLYAEEYRSLPAVWLIGSEAATLGRDEAAQIVVPVNAVSRSHARIQRDRGSWSIRDLGSRNGTFVDGRLATEAALEPATEIRIGDALLKFVLRHGSEYARYRIDGTLDSGARRLSRSGSALVGGLLMDRIAADVERIAPTELNVMLLGESGTGKEVVAKELHRVSGRRGNFCAINCAAIPAQLIESELFGFKRGAFSGADRDKPGLVRTAHGGTLLLDEIGDMPTEAQAKLLRVLQSKEVFPLGGAAPEQVDVRFVCATHRDLGRLQQTGRFREDLFARLNEYQLTLPPLRERKEDVFLLARTFLGRHGRAELELSFPFMTGLLHYDWPYNVRELEACIKRCVALCDATTLGEEHLPDAIRDAMSDYGEPVSTPRGSVPPDVTRTATPSEHELKSLLEAHRGNVAAVGRELGKARMQIHRWMKRYQIDIDDYR